MIGDLVVLERELENMTYLFEFVPCFNLPGECSCTCICSYNFQHSTEQMF